MPNVLPDAALGLASVSLRDYPTGLNVVTFDIDPTTYAPFNDPIRGSSTKVLDGTVVHQVFGTNPADWTIQVAGRLTSYITFQALWSKYRQGGGGTFFEWRDWYPSRY